MLKNGYYEPTDIKNFIRTSLPLFSIFLLALILRIYNLDGESYWLDEFYSIQVSRLSPLEILNEIVLSGENNPPIYFVLLHFWTAVFGESEFASRLLSVLMGSFSVFLIYIFGKELINKNTGLIAALILAVSPFQVYYSQEARAYILLVLVTLANYYFFFRLSRSYSIKLASGYVLSGAILIYTHYFWVFYIAAQNIYVFTRLSLNVKGEWPGTRPWILLQLVLLIIFLPELQLLLTAGALSGGFWIDKPNIKNVLWLFLEFSGSYTLLALFFILSLFRVFTDFGVESRSSLRQIINRSDDSSRTRIDRTYLLVVLLFAPIVLSFIVSITIKPIFLSRYLIGSSPALYLLVAAGIDRIENSRVKILFIVLIAGLSLLQVYRGYVTVDKHQWRDAAEYLDKNAASGDLLVVTPSYETDSLKYYLKRGDLRINALPPDTDLDFNSSGEYIWVISADHGDLNNMVNARSLSKHNSLLSEKDYTKLKIYKLAGKTN